MTTKSYKVNYFLLIYLVLYIAISFFGTRFLDKNLVSRISQFLPLFLGTIYLLVTKQSPIKATGIRGIHIGTIPLVLLFTICLWPLISVANTFSMLFSRNLISGTVNQTVLNGGLVYGLVTMALFPAVIEEFSFRGVVYGQYRRTSPIKGIFLSALCFGLIHMNFNQFTYAFLMGLFLALLVEASGSLLTSIFMHFTFNATSVCMVFLAQKKPGISAAAAESGSVSMTKPEVLLALRGLLPFAIIGTVLAFVILYWIACINGRKNAFSDLTLPGKDYHNAGPKIVSITLILFIIICLIMCVLVEITN